MAGRFGTQCGRPACGHRSGHRQVLLRSRSGSRRTVRGAGKRDTSTWRRRTGANSKIGSNAAAHLRVEFVHHVPGWRNSTLSGATRQRPAVCIRLPESDSRAAADPASRGTLIREASACSRGSARNAGAKSLRPTTIARIAPRRLRPAVVRRRHRLRRPARQRRLRHTHHHRRRSSKLTFSSRSRRLHRKRSPTIRSQIITRRLRRSHLILRRPGITRRAPRPHVDSIFLCG